MDNRVERVECEPDGPYDQSDEVEAKGPGLQPIGDGKDYGRSEDEAGK